MKKLLYILLFANCLLPAAYCQVNFDSLWGVWNDESQPDTARLKAIHKIAWDGYLFTQPDSAFYFAQWQYDFAKSKGLKKRMADALKIIGASYYLRGDYEQAITYYTRSLKITKEVGNKIDISNLLNNIGNIYSDQSDYDQAIAYYTRSLKIFKEIGDKQGIAMSLNNIGSIYYDQGNYDYAIEYYTRSLKIRKDIGDKQGIASSLNNIGIIYQQQGDHALAIDYHTRCLKIFEDIKDKPGIAISLNNIGNIYFDQSGYAHAIEYYTRSLKIREEIGDKHGIGMSLNNIGNVYKEQNDSSLAIEYHTRSLKIKEEIGDKIGMAISLNNIGSIYHKFRFFSQAMDYYIRSLKIRKSIGDKQGIASSLSNIGNTYKEQGEFQKAIECSEKALSIAQEVGVANETRNAANVLYEAYKATGNNRKALEMYELYIATRDSMLSEENQKEVIRQKFKYDYEKKEAVADAEHEAEMQRQEEVAAAEKKRQNIIIGSVGSGLGLVVIFSIFLFNRFRVTRRQKNIIEEQKEEVDKAYDTLEEKNTEIMDSIQYAKRIQTAILPPQKLVKQYLEESFILYKPKDIVAGDFYWMEVEGDKIFFTAADCTGHGVPGAMVSVMCSTALSKAVKELGIYEPAKILDKTVELLEERFSKSEEEVKDGMDLALCCLNTKTNQLQYAGANNPLYHLTGGEITEIKADKQPIGSYEGRKPYTNHEITLNKGDSIYIFSDGFADQFGGPKGKKFKYKPFRELLLANHSKPMQEQKQLLDECIENWRGELEQVDDICVIGVRV